MTEDVAEHDIARSILARCDKAELAVVKAEPGMSDQDVLLRAFDIPEWRAPDQDLSALSRQCLMLWDTPELTQPMATGPAWERRCFNFMKILPYVGTCTFNCSYCWFKDPVLIPRVNVRFFDRLPAFLADYSARAKAPATFTFTHYKTDCFGLEHLTGFCRLAAETFERYDEYNVQFLTKSSWIDSLLVEPVPTSALVGFSINAREVVESVDLGTASLEQRLEAAARLHGAGIAVIFRVDPMMIFAGWERSYRDLARMVLDCVRPAQVTLGTPRFQTPGELQRVVDTTRAPRARRFMAAQLPLMGVTKPGQSLQTDNTEAYFKNMAVSYADDDRYALYSNAADAFLKLDPSLNVGLCEEGPEMWERVGLSWSGDRTKDCSCNFVGPTSERRLGPAHRRQLQLLQVDAIANDAACRSRATAGREA